MKSAPAGRSIVAAKRLVSATMLDLYNYPMLVVFLVSVAVILGACEIGRRLGIRAAGRGGDNIATLEAAMLGLLALLIGFTFAWALSRFEARRDAVLNEANAIGTTALRARLLPEPHRAETLKLLREYVKIRLDITQRPVSQAELAAAIQRSDALQEALWQQAKAVAAKDNAMVPTGLFIQTLNDMIDNQAKRLAAFRIACRTSCCWRFSALRPSPAASRVTRAGSRRDGPVCRCMSRACWSPLSSC
jgi:hypothetical protein